MLGASSSEDDDDESANYGSTGTDRDDNVSEAHLVQAVPDARSNRGHSFRSFGSVSPTGSELSINYSGSLKNGGVMTRNSSLRSPQKSTERYLDTGNGPCSTPSPSTPAYARRTVSQTGSLSPSPSIRSTLSEKKPAKTCSLVSINEAGSTDGQSVREEPERYVMGRRAPPFYFHSAYF